MSAEQVAQAYAALDPVMLELATARSARWRLIRGAPCRPRRLAMVLPVTVTVTDPDGAAITLTDGKFTPSKEGIYTLCLSNRGWEKDAGPTARKAVDMDNLPVTLGLVSADQAAAGGQFNVSVHLNRDSGTDSRQDRI